MDDIERFLGSLKFFIFEKQIPIGPISKIYCREFIN